MASPFQQQIRQRKLLYLGLILVFFTASIGWRHSIIDRLAERLAIREQSRGDVELIGAVVRLGLTGSRGLATCVLWSNAMEKQKKNQWNELEVLVRSLTRLQPHFITPWLFQSWNLSYNVSVESDRVRDKYFYVSRGIDLLTQGERQNRNHPDLRWSVGFYLQHKVYQSDETNYMRSLFQLSIIPPNERDPARFWKQTDSGPEFNWVEFKDFSEKHPQLVRRLNRGMQRDTARDKKRLFLCERPEDVVQFLEDNYTVPSLYVVESLPADIPVQSRGWIATKNDTLLEPEQRFPLLPLPHADAFDEFALTTSSTLRDETDGNGVAHAWYSYAQEPLPSPGPLPGSSEAITDPARQRRPKNMTTLIFRHYPAMARRYQAERLQQEGWFDGEGWDMTELFRDAKAPELAGKQILVGAGPKWSLDAWLRARTAWEQHGRYNHLLFANAAAEETDRDLARRYAKKHRIPLYSSVPSVREDDLSTEDLREHRAASFMYEYEFYRRLTNFHHHYIRATVEALPNTVLCRKMFYKADQAFQDGSPLAAIRYYQTPIEFDVAGEHRKLDPLTAWRDVILLGNKEFRRDAATEEMTAEIQLRYFIVWNRYDGREIKEQLVKASQVLPLLPRFDPVTFRPPIVQGPFDVNDSEGVPLVNPSTVGLILDRMGFRNTAPPPASPAAQPGKGVTPTP